MRKYFILYILLLFVFSGFSQTVPSIDSLRSYNTKYTTNSALLWFSNLRGQTLLRGIIDRLDSVNNAVGGPGAYYIDSLYAANDSLVYFRNNEIWYGMYVKGVYDSRRKVDTIWAANDTLLIAQINGQQRPVTIKGIQGIGNVSVGSGYKITATKNFIKSLTSGSGVLLDSTVAGEINISVDSVKLVNDVTNLIRKVDTIYAYDDTTFYFEIGGTPYAVIMRGVGGSSSSVSLLSVGTGYKITTSIANRIKSFRKDYGILMDTTSTTTMLGIGLDTATYTSYLSGRFNNTTVGSGIPVAISNSRNVKSLEAGYATIIDTSVTNLIRIRLDSSTVFTYVRNNTNLTSLGSAARIGVTGTKNVKSLATAYGTLVDTTANTVAVRLDSSVVFPQVRNSLRKVDTVYSVNDSVFAYRINGITYNVSVKGKTETQNLLTSLGSGVRIGIPGTLNVKSGQVGYGLLWDTTANTIGYKFDSATAFPQVRNSIRKVDTVYSVSDSVIAYKINGTTYNITVKGGANTPQNTLTSLGTGARIGVTGTNNVKSLAAVYGNLVDTTANTVAVRLDSAIVFPQVRNSFKRVDTIYSVNDSVFTYRLNGVTYNITVKGKGDPVQSTLSSLGGIRIGIPGTMNVKGAQVGYGLLWDTTANTIGYRFDSSTVFGQYRATDTTTLTGDVSGKGKSSIATTIATGAVTSTKILDNTIANADIRQSAALSLIGNGTNATANVADISASTDFTVLRRSGTALGFGLLDSNSIPALRSEAYYNTKFLKTPQLGTYLKQVGTGVELGFQQVDSFKLKRLQAGTGITITRNADSSLTLTSSASASTLTSIGTGARIGVTGTNNVKSALNGWGTQVDTTANTVAYRVDSASVFSAYRATDTTTLTGDVTGKGKNTIASTISNNAVTSAKILDNTIANADLRQSAALSVIGNNTNAVANVADISASTDFGVLRRSGTTLGFALLDSNSVPTLRSEAYYNTKFLKTPQLGTYLKLVGAGVELGYQQVDSFKLKRINAGTGISITRNTDSSLTITNTTAAPTSITGLTGDVSATGPGNVLATIQPSAVTSTKILDNTIDGVDIRQSSAYSVLGNTNTTTANIGDITAGTIWHVLRRTATNLSFGLLDSNSVPALRSEGYYNTKYTLLTGVDDRVKNIGAGTQLSFPRNDSVIIKRINAGSNITLTQNSDSSLTINSQQSIVNSIKNAGAGFELGFQQVDSFKVKRVQAGTGVTITRNADSSLTFSAPAANGITSLTGEVLATGPGAAAATIRDTAVTTNKIATNAVTDSKLRNGAAYSVIGRSANTSGTVSDIAAGTDGFVLRRSGTSLGFGLLDSTNIAANSITPSKLAKVAALSVRGNPTNATADITNITASADNQVLKRSGTTLVFGSVPAAGSTYQVQYNVGGSLVGDSTFRYDSTQDRLIIRDTGNYTTGKYSSMSSKRIVVGDSANTADNGYAMQVYRESDGKGIYTNGSVRLDGTQRAGVNDSMFLVKGTDSIVRQIPRRLITANAAGGNFEVQYGYGGVLQATPNVKIDPSDDATGRSKLEVTGYVHIYDTASFNRSNSSSNFIVAWDSTNSRLYMQRYNNSEGSYTPTLTGVTNITSATLNNAYYTVTGKTVTVWGSLNIAVTTINANAEVTISLPISSTTLVADMVNGNGWMASSFSMGTIIGDATNKVARFGFVGPSVAVPRVYYFRFIYRYN